ncbi:hypothetical protein BC829DRAFT_417810 [Chytridium lagenaria]|nr:hypothetical protein BC829DRAFT_417810 [Chytridium lagenaria]
MQHLPLETVKSIAARLQPSTVIALENSLRSLRLNHSLSQDPTFCLSNLIFLFFRRHSVSIDVTSPNSILRSHRHFSAIPWYILSSLPWIPLLKRRTAWPAALFALTGFDIETIKFLVRSEFGEKWENCDKHYMYPKESRTDSVRHLLEDALLDGLRMWTTAQKDSAETLIPDSLLSSDYLILWACTFDAHRFLKTYLDACPWQYGRPGKMKELRDIPRRGWAQSLGAVDLDGTFVLACGSKQSKRFKSSCQSFGANREKEESTVPSRGCINHGESFKCVGRRHLHLGWVHAIEQGGRNFAVLWDVRSRFIDESGLLRVIGACLAAAASLCSEEAGHSLDEVDIKRHGLLNIY